MAWQRYPTKYGNKKVEFDGKTFDSKKEANRYSELRLLERAGAISDLQTQVKFELIPAQKINGKVVERAVTYVADFVYEIPVTMEKLYSMKDGKIGSFEVQCSPETVVEDTKGVKTKDYIIKRKLMLWVHGIQIKEI